MRYSHLLLLLLLLWTAPVRAALIGDADQPYSATRTVIADGRAYVGEMRSAPGMQRHEQTVNGIRFVVILRADRDVAWLLLPDFNVYAALPLSDTLTRYADRASLGRPRGTDRLNGLSAAKYRLHHIDQSGALAEGWLWMTATGLVPKLQGNYTSPNGHKTAVTLLLSDIEPGEQDPGYFVVPAGMSALPPQAVAGLLGMDVKGLPAQ
jgi:hypothetical protein